MRAYQEIVVGARGLETMGMPACVPDEHGSSVIEKPVGVSDWRVVEEGIVSEQHDDHKYSHPNHEPYTHAEWIHSPPVLHHGISPQEGFLHPGTAQPLKLCFYFNAALIFVH